MVDGLAEADAGVDPDLLDAGVAGQAGAFEDEGRDLVYDVVVLGVVLHGARLALHVHGDPAGTGGGGDFVEGGGDVVDQRGAGGDGGGGDDGLGGVDGDADAEVSSAQGVDDRDDPFELDAGGDELCAGAGGLAADVDTSAPSLAMAMPWATAWSKVS